MRRRELLRHFNRHGCVLLRESIGFGPKSKFRKSEFGFKIREGVKPERPQKEPVNNF